MPHTQSRYQQDLGFTDAKLFAAPNEDIIAFGTTVLTRTAAGNINFAQAASQAVTYDLCINSLLARRLGFFEDIQAGLQIPAASIVGSAQPQFYRPDQIGNMNTGQQLQPRTAFKTKGIKLRSYDVIYQVTTNPLTVHTTRVDQSVFTGVIAAPTITPVLATGANGLATAAQANMYVTTVTPTAQPYFITNDAQLWIELAVTTPAGGTYTLWGLDVSFEFNYN